MSGYRLFATYFSKILHLIFFVRKGDTVKAFFEKSMRLLETCLSHTVCKSRVARQRRGGVASQRAGGGQPEVGVG